MEENPDNFSLLGLLEVQSVELFEGLKVVFGLNEGLEDGLLHISYHVMFLRHRLHLGRLLRFFLPGGWRAPLISMLTIVV